MNNLVEFSMTYGDWVGVLVVAFISNTVMVGGLVFVFTKIVTKKLNNMAKLVK